MKTICIYDQCGEDPISFFVLEGLHPEFYGVYINSGHELEAALSAIIYGDNGLLVTFLDTFPHEDFGPETIVIVCGFIP